MIKIIEAQKQYYSSHTDALNAVASERLYLSVYGGFTEEMIESFHIMCDRESFPHYFVINENDTVVGWCDIVSRSTHPKQVGFLGIGLLPEYREHGIGRKLIEISLADAKDKGFREIRLECRTDNKRAIHVYKKLGFKKYAQRRKALVIENDKYDLLFMKKRLK